MNGRRDMGDIFAEEEAAALVRVRAEIAAERADPEWQARTVAKLAAYEAEVDAQIAAGLRDADGVWIDPAEVDEEDEEEGDEEEG